MIPLTETTSVHAKFQLRKVYNCSYKISSKWKPRDRCKSHEL